MDNQTFTTGSSGEDVNTGTANAADSVPAKIDLVDTVFFTSLALGIDTLGLIPVVGEICSPIGIGGFRALFWFKGINSSMNNWLMGATGVSEIVPGVSEVLPGCTAYVLTVCLTERYAAKIGNVAELVAKVSPEPETKAVAMGIAAAAKMQQGQSAEQAIGGQLAGAVGGGAAGTQSAGATGSATTTTSSGVSAKGSISGDFDFGGGQAVTERGQQPSKAGGGIPPANAGENAGAPGSPLVEGKPQAGQDTGNVNNSFMRERQRELEEERREREEKKRAA